MKWMALLHKQNSQIPIPEQVSKVSKGITDASANENNYAVNRTDVERQYPEILTLSDGRQVRRGDVLDCALKTEDDPLGLGDWPDLMKPECMMAFTHALLIDGQIQPLAHISNVSDSVISKMEITDPLDDLPLLPEDRRFIDSQLYQIPRNQHSDVLTRYRDIWIGTADAEPDINRKDNTGRRAANTFLLRNET